MAHKANVRAMLGARGIELESARPAGPIHIVLGWNHPVEHGEHYYTDHVLSDGESTSSKVLDSYPLRGTHKRLLFGGSYAIVVRNYKGCRKIVRVVVRPDFDEAAFTQVLAKLFKQKYCKKKHTHH